MKRAQRLEIFPLRPCSWAGIMILVAALAFQPLITHAHDSPEHVAEALTARMAEQGRTAELLWQRSTEHRALRQLEAAAADLREAIRLQPDFFTARADLGRVQLHLGKTDESLATLEQAVEAAPDEATRAPLYLTRAEVRAARGELDAAVADCARAFAAIPGPEAEWYLLRAQFQLRLGKAAEAAAGLEKGFEQTGSPVLEAEWIDALLDSHEARAALARIEPQLAESRCQATWLIRRGRARLALGQSVKARGDFHSAVTEINGRLSPARPEVSLLADRGLAFALLGDHESARRDLATARKAGAETWVTWRLEARLAGSK